MEHKAPLPPVTHLLPGTHAVPVPPVHADPGTTFQLPAFLPGHETILTITGHQHFGRIAGVVAGAVAIVWVSRNILEWHAVASFMTRVAVQNARSWIVTTRATRRLNRQNRAERRQLKHYQRKGEGVCRHEIDKLRRRAAFKLNLASILEQQADKHAYQSFRSRWLNNRIARRVAESDRLIAKAERIEAMLIQIVAENETATRATAQREAIKLVNQLASPIERRAMKALMELNKLAPSIDWESLLQPASNNIPDLVLARLVKVLRLMAGTDALMEARVAKQQAEQMMSGHGLDWQKLAA